MNLKQQEILCHFICTCSSLKPGSLGAGVLGDGFGALRYGVLGQFPWEQQAHSSLHLTACDGRAFVVLRQSGRLGGDSLKHVVHKRVHDAHGSARDARVRVHLQKTPTNNPIMYL